jgi:hypothetical protein
MMLRHASRVILVCAAAVTACNGNADSSSADSGSFGSGDGGGVQPWPGGDAASDDADGAVPPAPDAGEDAPADAVTGADAVPGADAEADAGRDAEEDAGVDAQRDAIAGWDAGPAVDAGDGAPWGVPCGAFTCWSGQLCCDVPAPVTGYCTLECVSAPGCPLLTCRMPPPDGGPVDASSFDGGSFFDSPGIDATPADAAPPDAAPASCSDLKCPPLDSCCMEPMGGKCTPKCVPNGIACSPVCI